MLRERQQRANDAQEKAKGIARTEGTIRTTAPPPGGRDHGAKPPRPQPQRRGNLNVDAVHSRIDGFAPTKRAVGTYLALTTLAATIIVQEFTRPGFRRGELITPVPDMLSQLGLNLVTFGIGFLVALLPLLLISAARDIVLAIIAAIITALVLTPGIGTWMTSVSGVFGLALGIVVFGLLTFRGGTRRRVTTFGSAEWASLADVEAAKLTQGKGYFLGGFTDGPETFEELHYAGDRHLLTVAPTRAGKGVSAIIPNLLTYPGSALVIDPKGENALITAIQRHKMGHAVMLVDPWDLASSRMGTEPARFNPIDWLRPDDPDIGENAMLLADALVVPSGGGKDKFWDEEAKALLVGLILYVATADEEADHRNLGRVRDLLMLNKTGMTELFGTMAMASNHIVATTGSRFLLKSEELLSNVLATAQSHTHFLDSPRIRESLSVSDFGFEQLKTHRMSIYLILPADRLNTFGRWLRLLIQQAITVNARNIDQKPAHPVLFMLDEMPALGHLSMIEQAYGLMAGFGIQLWGIVQDLSQLKRIYGDSWETFIGNSGVLQYFGSRDQMTANYFSSLCGVTTTMNIGESIARSFSSSANGSSSSTSNSTTFGHIQRSLAFPDELMRMPDHQQLLLVQNHNPISGLKMRWYEHPVLKTLGVNLNDQQQADDPETPPEPEPAMA